MSQDSACRFKSILVSAMVHHALAVQTALCSHVLLLRYCLGVCYIALPQHFQDFVLLCSLCCTRVEAIPAHPRTNDARVVRRMNPADEPKGQTRRTNPADEPGRRTWRTNPADEPGGRTRRGPFFFSTKTCSLTYSSCLPGVPRGQVPRGGGGRKN